MFPSVPRSISADDFAQFGSGEWVYLRTMTLPDLKNLIPDLPDLVHQELFWVLLDANGTPLIVADSSDMATQDLVEQNMTQQTVH